MSEQALYKNLMMLGAGVEVCLEQKRIAPALILLYSAIDTTGWLDSAERDATRASFLQWVDSYLLKVKPLACTSLDLYAARCGLLHTFTPDSRLSIEGKARRICYAWGTASVQNLQRTIDLMNKSSEIVAVHVNELYEGWRLGLSAFVTELESDLTRKARVYEKAGKFFGELGIDAVESAVRVLEKR